MEARVELVRSRDRTRTFCTHERTCVGAANTLTNCASQTDEMERYNKYQKSKHTKVGGLYLAGWPKKKTICTYEQLTHYVLCIMYLDHALSNLTG